MHYASGRNGSSDTNINTRPLNLLHFCLCIPSFILQNISSSGLKNTDKQLAYMCSIIVFGYKTYTIQCSESGL